MNNSELSRIAAIVEHNSELESTSIKEYSYLLEILYLSDLPDKAISNIVGVIKEIISDELNHQQKLQELYTYITDIHPNKE